MKAVASDPEMLAVIQRLLGRCPDLTAAWRRNRTDDDAEPLAYLQAAALADAVAEALSKGDMDCLDGVFAEAEEVITSGTQEARELVVVGFLEDLQSALGWREQSLALAEQLLGPNSRHAWNELLEMWAEIARKKASGELPSGPFDQAAPSIHDPKLQRMFRQIYRPPASDDASQRADN